MNTTRQATHAHWITSPLTLAALSTLALAIAAVGCEDTFHSRELPVELDTQPADGRIDLGPPIDTRDRPDTSEDTTLPDTRTDTRSDGTSTCTPAGSLCSNIAGEECCERMLCRMACDGRRRCVEAAGCFPVGDACTTSDDCCSRQCDSATRRCVSPISCQSLGTFCNFDSECCDGRCLNGTCQPAPLVCPWIGSPCSTNTCAGDPDCECCPPLVCDAATGTCQEAEGERPNGCLTDADCPDGVCVNGLCDNSGDGIACVPDGNPCDDFTICCSGSNCPSSGICGGADEPPAECFTDADCPSGSVCNAGFCELTMMCLPIGSSCTTEFDCCTGICRQGTCSDKCAPGLTPCTSHSECCTFFCRDDGLCQPDGCLLDGELCFTDNDCCDGSCVNGICSLGPNCIPNGDRCEIDAGCCTNVCDIVTRTCISCRGVGDSCVRDRECCTDNCRFGGVCGEEKCRELGDQCEEDAQCCDGVCDPLRDVCVACINDGGTCDANSDCCGGTCDLRTNTCTDAAACAGPGGPCVTTAHCGDGLVCRSGFCQ